MRFYETAYKKSTAFKKIYITALFFSGTAFVRDFGGTKKHQRYVPKISATYQTTIGTRIDTDLALSFISKKRPALLAGQFSG